MRQKTYKLIGEHSRVLMEKYRNVEISKIEVLCKRLDRMKMATLHLLSMGTFHENNEYKDNLYHMKILVHLVNKQKLIMDKPSSHLRLTQDKMYFYSNSDIPNIVIPCKSKHITLGSLYDNTLKKMGSKKFFSYDPATNNCQTFVFYVLSANDLIHPNVKKRIMSYKQNTKKIFAKHPRLRKTISVLSSTSLGKYIAQFF